jgi:hypothetical protein
MRGVICALSFGRKFWGGLGNMYIGHGSVSKTYLDGRITCIFLEELSDVHGIVLGLANVIRCIRVNWHTFTCEIPGLDKFFTQPTYTCLSPFNRGELLDVAFTAGALIPGFGCAVFQFALNTTMSKKLACNFQNAPTP